MPKYKVEFRAYAFATDTVEAEDEAEAIELAFANGFPQVCAQCSGWGKEFSLELPDDSACWEAVDTREVED
jgi:hypothetical protein